MGWYVDRYTCNFVNCYTHDDRLISRWTEYKSFNCTAKYRITVIDLVMQQLRSGVLVSFKFITCRVSIMTLICGWVENFKRQTGPGTLQSFKGQHIPLLPLALAKLKKFQSRRSDLFLPAEKHETHTKIHCSFLQANIMYTRITQESLSTTSNIEEHSILKRYRIIVVLILKY